jgi:DNA excision repair protein ERCC-3
MYSLFAAVSVGLQPTDILEVLNRLSKSPVPASVAAFVLDNTQSFGKVKLVLKQNRYYIESAHADVLRRLLQDEVIGPARITEAEGESRAQNGRLQVLGRAAAPKRGDLVIPGTEGAARKAAPANAAAAAGAGGAQIGARPGARPAAPAPPTTGSGVGREPPGSAAGASAAMAGAAAATDADLFSAIIGVDDEADEAAALDDEDVVHSFEIREELTEDVRRRCNDIGFPMLEEYDFRNDRLNADLDIDLKPVTHIRPYQEKSLSKMFGNGRARSGIIVLPCGAGKTLVGITAACTIKKSCLVLCTSSVSVMQWKREFMQWSNIQDNQISVFTADQKEKVRHS